MSTNPDEYEVTVDGQPWHVVAVEPDGSLRCAPAEYPAEVPAGAMIVVRLQGEHVAAIPWHPYPTELGPGDTLQAGPGI